jgi:hypothetical protein
VLVFLASATYLNPEHSTRLIVAERKDGNRVSELLIIFHNVGMYVAYQEEGLEGVATAEEEGR